MSSRMLDEMLSYKPPSYFQNSSQTTGQNHDPQLGPKIPCCGLRLKAAITLLAVTQAYNFLQINQFK